MMCMLVTDIHAYEMTKSLTILHNKEVGDLCLSPSIVRILSFKGHVFSYLWFI
jgi:hypothetical protein